MSSLELLKERTKSQLTRREVRINAEIFSKVRAAIERFAQQNGYIGIFRLEKDPSDIQDPEIQAYKMNTMQLFYSDPSADVTTEILNLLNSEYRKAGAAKETAAPISSPSASAMQHATRSRSVQPAQTPPGPPASRLDLAEPTKIGDHEFAQNPNDSADGVAVLLKHLLRQNRLLNERLAKLASTLDSTLRYLTGKAEQLNGQAGEFATGVFGRPGV